MTQTPAGLDSAFLRRRPGGALRGLVDTVWIWRGTVERDGRDRMLPTGTAGFVVNLAQDETRIYDPTATELAQRLDGAGYAGAHDRPFVIDTAEQRFAAGVEFHAAGAWPFFDAAQDELANGHFALRDLWGFDAERLREALLRVPLAAALDILERALLSRLRTSRAKTSGDSSRAENRAVTELATRIARDPSRPIAALADATSTARRRLTRRFEQQVGMPPKRYARLVRFRRLLRDVHLAPIVDWADLAAAHGFYDQAHLIRDFKAFSHLTPTEYLTAATHLSNHVPLD